MSSWAMRTSALAIVLALCSGTALAQRRAQGDDDSIALVNEGRAALRRGALDDAARALDLAISLNPLRVDAYVVRSGVYARLGRYVDGIAVLRRARAIAPTDEEVLAALGAQLVLSGQPDEGIPLLEQVVAARPTRYSAQLLLGGHYRDHGRWPQAIAAFEAYFANRPSALAAEDGQPRYELADAYLRADQPQAALRAFRDAEQAGLPGLRARIGIAWALAAIDCAMARPLLRALELAGAHEPELGLVDGECALRLGDTEVALARGQRYLARAGDQSAAGLALVGGAEAVLGRRLVARRELERARALAPAWRLPGLRLAGVLREDGDPAAALALLDALGPPAPADREPSWWVELGEALVAHGEPREALIRLAPIVAELPHEPAVRTVVGAAQLAVGDPAAAVATLDDPALRGQPRPVRLLAEALAAVAVRALAAGDAPAAEVGLARAAELAPSAAILRDLGIAWLALDRPAVAVVALDRALERDPAPITMMLAARARALSGELVPARAIYQRALAGAREDAVEISIDWAASELSGGDPARAISALESTLAQAVGTPLAARHRTALATARHAAALAVLRANPARAAELLRASAVAEPALATWCDLAVAAVASGDSATAVSALAAVAPRRCPFPTPADHDGLAILGPLSDGRNPRLAQPALSRLIALIAASGSGSALLGAAVRVVALAAADDAYRGGELGRARELLAIASAAHTRVGEDELAYDLAVLDLADGRLDAAIAQLRRLAPTPDALIALGLAFERLGDPREAVAAWRRAHKAGATLAALPGWIEAKERLFGDLP